MVCVCVCVRARACAPPRSVSPDPAAKRSKDLKAEVPEQNSAKPSHLYSTRPPGDAGNHLSLPTGIHDGSYQHLREGEGGRKKGHKGKILTVSWLSKPAASRTRGQGRAEERGWISKDLSLRTLSVYSFWKNVKTKVFASGKSLCTSLIWCIHYKG